MVIGYYVHHVGAGHRIRAGVLARELLRRGHDVTLLGTDLPEGSASGVQIMHLASDATAGGHSPDAGGALHWSPLRHNGYSERMQSIASWVSTHRPDVVVVDVSVEVSVLVRLLGVPVVVVAQPGDRGDQPHTLAYRCASAILAPWPEAAHPCPALTAFKSKVQAVGGISRYAEPQPPRFVASPRDPSAPPRGLILTGGHVHGVDQQRLSALPEAVPEVEWVTVGAAGLWLEDVSPLLAEVALVVSHAGQNSIADIAACGTPALVVPQERPHHEQQRLAHELERLGLARLWREDSSAPRQRPGGAAADPDLVEVGHPGRRGSRRRSHRSSHPMSAQTWVVTTARGRHAHLREQLRLLARTDTDVHQVVVAMGDSDLSAVVEDSRDERRVEVLSIDIPATGELPLAAARNLGVEHAIADGADLIVLLDVDCVVLPGTLETYRRAATWRPGALLAGPVTYLAERTALPRTPEELPLLRDPHPARPDPAPGTLIDGGDLDLFWSLNAAFTQQTWRSIGGFCTDYVGYGAEDTDFGRLAGRANVDLVWVGGADALHQWHPVSSPPVEHLEAIIRNAHVFHRRWGQWPMEGWLRAFAEAGLVDFSEDSLVQVQPPRTG